MGARKVVYSKFTPAELRDFLLQNSTCKVRCKGAGQKPMELDITFTGPIARIPNLKNSQRSQAFEYKNKETGVRQLGIRSFLDSNFIAQVKAMDILFNEAMRGIPTPVDYGKEAILMMPVFGYRQNRFDEDGACSTLKDWLEPGNQKKGGSDDVRGWGCGIIADDNTVLGWPMHAKHCRDRNEETVIMIRPWSSVVFGVAGFLENHIHPPFLLSRPSTQPQLL